MEAVIFNKVSLAACLKIDSRARQRQAVLEDHCSNPGEMAA